MGKPVCQVDVFRVRRNGPPAETVRSKLEASVQARLDDGFTLRTAVPLECHREGNTEITLLVYVKRERGR